MPSASPPSAALVLRSLLFELWFYTSMAVMGVALAPVAIVSQRGAYWAMRLFCRQAFWVAARLCGLRTTARGAIPRGDVVIAAKHQSFLDVMMLMRWLDRPKFIMKRSLVWAPVLGLYALRIGATPIDRAAGARAVRRIQARRGAPANPCAPEQVVIYPQGSRIAPGEAAPYRRGVAALTAARGVACVPVATNAGVFWGRRSLLRRPGTAVIAFLDPISPDMPSRAFMTALEDRVEAASDALVTEARDGA